MNTERGQKTLIDPMRVAAMQAALGHAGQAPSAGEALPHFWHWSQFWDISQPDQLGRDGHPKTGTFIPDLNLPRRMWAGGSLDFKVPLKIGTDAERTSKIMDITKKTGRSGPLAFVTIEHEIKQSGQLCISERQDLVYRDDPAPNAPPLASKLAPNGEDALIAHSVTKTDLFRYSALTFNGHRIHYDLEYAQEVEGYPGLVTHGPLLAQRLIELAMRELGDVNRFAFRAVSPLFHFEQFEACAKASETGLDLWIRGPDGRLNMTAQAS